MVARLTKAEQRNFIGLLTSMGDGDGSSAASFLLRFSQAGHHSAEAKKAFAAAVSELFRRVCKGYGHNTDIGEVLRGVLSLCREHKVSIDANYATLVMNALC
jgi:aarF domain-containing kinase